MRATDCKRREWGGKGVGNETHALLVVFILGDHNHYVLSVKPALMGRTSLANIDCTEMSFELRQDK